MTAEQRLERDLPSILDEIVMGPYPDYIDDVLSTTARGRQRPGWTFPERWLPVEITTTRVPQTRLPWRQLLILAALIALTQTDLKRVLAYSTISQLGYMFLALGSATRSSSGSDTLVHAAVIAAIFHLFTHAFFKALLFLSAGSVMHAMGDVIDMRRFSGLRRVLPTTHVVFLCGAGALAAVGCPSNVSQSECFRRGSDVCVFEVSSAFTDARWDHTKAR